MERTSILVWIDRLIVSAFFAAMAYTLISVFVQEASGAQPPNIQAIIYSAPDCAPCQRMKAEFKRAGILARFEERPEELDRQKITVTPTTIIFRDDKRVWTKVGYISAFVMKRKLAEYGK